MTPDERGENYIAPRPPWDDPEPALTSPNGLDFSGKESVNPEDVRGGTPMNPAFEEVG